MPFPLPRHARPSLTSCPTRSGISRLPVKPAMTIWCHALPSSSSCPTFSYVMPDSDRASHFSPRHARPSLTSCPTSIGHLYPLQIAGQAGNDEKTAGNDDMVPCPFLFFVMLDLLFLVMPDPLSSSCPTPIGHPPTSIAKKNRIFCHFHDSCYICQ